MGSPSRSQGASPKGFTTREALKGWLSCLTRMVERNLDGRDLYICGRKPTRPIRLTWVVSLEQSGETRNTDGGVMRLCDVSFEGPVPLLEIKSGANCHFEQHELLREIFTLEQPSTLSRHSTKLQTATYLFILPGEGSKNV